MSFNIIVTENFERKVKRLAKKYKSLKSDLTPVFEQLTTIPQLGKALEIIALKSDLPSIQKDEANQVAPE